MTRRPSLGRLSSLRSNRYSRALTWPGLVLDRPPPPHLPLPPPPVCACVYTGLMLFMYGMTVEFCSLCEYSELVSSGSSISVITHVQKGDSSSGGKKKRKKRSFFFLNTSAVWVNVHNYEKKKKEKKELYLILHFPPSPMLFVRCLQCCKFDYHLFSWIEACKKRVFVTVSTLHMSYRVFGIRDGKIAQGGLCERHTNQFCKQPPPPFHYCMLHLISLPFIKLLVTTLDQWILPLQKLML